MLNNNSSQSSILSKNLIVVMTFLLLFQMKAMAQEKGNINSSPKNENREFVSALKEKDSITIKTSLGLALNSSNQFEISEPGQGIAWPNNKKPVIVIKKTDKQAVVLQDGKIIEGGNDYEKEELAELIDVNNASINGNGELKAFSYVIKNDD